MTTIMPRCPLHRLSNGNDALRMLDHFKCTPKEAFLLFVAVHQFSVDDEGVEIFCTLDSHFEALLILHRRNMLASDTWKDVVGTLTSDIDNLLTRLEQRVWPKAPPPPFRMAVEYAA